MSVMISDGASVDGVGSASDINRRSGSTYLVFNGYHHGDNLEGRAGFDFIDHDMIFRFDIDTETI